MKRRHEWTASHEDTRTAFSNQREPAGAAPLWAPPVAARRYKLQEDSCCRCSLYTSRRQPSTSAATVALSSHHNTKRQEGGMRHLALLLMAVVLGCALGQPPSSLNIDMASTLECHRRLYTYKVQQTDAAGRLCWDDVHVWSCWGRCDSNEISDWRFPFKRSFHPVCMHEDRVPRTVTLKNCESGASPGTEVYIVLEAASCRCSVCKSSEASCEGLRYRGQRSGQLLG